MQLAPATSTAQMPAPISVIVNLSTAAPHHHPRYGDRVASNVRAAFSEPDATVEASVSTYDPLWDGPYAQPADPSDWQVERTAASSPVLAAAVAGLRDAIAGADLATLPKAETTSDPDYATFHVRYAAKPVGLDHLRPWQERDGSWTVYLRTPLGTLFDEPRLAPLVEAARSVLAAAHP
ncbi:MAG: hypothetical protein JWM86_1361 [Thermoleophilia bacterium]|nr:hypothetical protein [Thermoleophilia bacterium]